MHHAKPEHVHVSQTIEVGHPLLRCTYDDSGEFVFVAGQDRRVWRVAADGSEVTEMPGHESWVLRLAIRKGKNELVSAGGEGRILWWNTSDAKPQAKRTTEAHHGWVRDVAFSSDGKLLASCGNDRLAKLWNADTGELVQVFEGHETHVDRVLFHPTRNEFVTADMNSTIIHWDATSGKKLRSMTAESLTTFNTNYEVKVGGIRGMTFLPDGKTLAVSGIRESPNAFGGDVFPGIVLFDFEAGKLLKEQKPKENMSAVLWEVEYHEDGYLIGVSAGHAGGHLHFYRSEDDNEFHLFKLPDVARDLSIDPTQMQVATAHHDKKLRISTLSPEKVS